MALKKRKLKKYITKMTHKNLLWELYNRMVDEFKKEHEKEMNDMMNYYVCISIKTTDFILYAEDEYKTLEIIITPIVRLRIILDKIFE
jgi:hypothetical protein